MTYYIGFSNKYYTLWKMTVGSYYVGEQHYNKYEYTYLKNLSFNKEEAFSKAPEGATYNETLRGISKSFTKEELVVDPNKFHLGKYCGKLFSEISDYNYMMWFYNNCVLECQKSNIENILFSNGYEFYDDTRTEIISPEDVIERNKHLEIMKIGNDIINNSSELNFLIKKNLDEYGEVLVSEYNLKIHFKNFDVREYNGYFYSLPIDNKGKAKRIKNKNIKITKFNILKDNFFNFIEVLDFEVIK